MKRIHRSSSPVRLAIILGFVIAAAGSAAAEESPVKSLYDRPSFGAESIVLRTVKPTV